jgi:hypothetical protein
MSKIIFVALIATLTCSAYAADPATPTMPSKEDMMKKFQEYSTPGEQHKKLAELAGEYTYTSKMWEAEGAKPMESKGTATFAMVLGGHFLQQNFKGQFMGQNFEGMGMIGYNNVKKQYETTWFDSMATGAMHFTGAYDAKKKTFASSGKETCPLTESHERDVRDELKTIDKNTMVYTMYSAFPGATKMAKTMEVTYKRVK